MDVAALQPSEPFERLPECCDPALDGRVGFHAVHQHADAPHCAGRLRARREGPRSRRAAEQRDEVATSHVPFAAYSHCFTEPVGRGGLRLRLTRPRTAPASMAATAIAT